MLYKALILDIDGTLIWRGRPHISKQVTDGLKSLQRRGVTVILATGRAAFACEGTVLGTDFVPDYRVCANGAFIVDRCGTPVFERYLTPAQVLALTDYAHENGYLLNFSFEDAYYTYVGHSRFLSFYEQAVGSSGYILDGAERDRHHESPPYGAYTTMPDEAARRYCGAHPDIMMKQSVPGSYDIMPAGVDKAVGIGMLLETAGIAWAQVVAAGDGENDIDMLQKAGIGVAMRNAPDVVRAAADVVAPPVDEDGILDVLRRYFGHGEPAGSAR